MKSYEFQHYILTRFNLLLWNKSKDGQKVRTAKWLEQRFSLFEKYCLPSIMNQTCQNFEWIVLFDSKTPVSFKERIYSFQKEFPKLIPVFVEPENGRYFAEIFRKEIVKRLKAKRVISTYLDNDDALNIRFVEDIQQRLTKVSDGSFIVYNRGYQYFADDKYLMQIQYPKNHFVSVVESGDSATIKGVFGYGSHAFIDKIKGLKIENVTDPLMWCEVIHKKNMMNDARFLKAKMVKDVDVLQRDFSIDVKLNNGIIIYLFKFIPRYCKTFLWRVNFHLSGMKC